MNRKWIGVLLSVVLAMSLFAALPAPRAVAVGCANSASTQFRSIATGNWGSTSTWECSDDGTNWLPANVTPTSSHGTITVRNGHTVTIAATVTVDQVTVDAGGQLTINSTITWTLADGTAIPDLTVNGTLLNQGGTWTSTGTWAVGAGGTYIHNTTGGISTPLNKSTLDTTSNFIYRGSSTLNTSVAMSGKTYGNLSFESSSGSWSPSAFSGGTATTIKGNVTIGSNVTINMGTLVGWNIAGNWTNNGVFTPGTTGVVAFSGTLGQSIGGSSATTFYSLMINNPSGVSLSSAMTANGTLTLTNGLLTLGTFDLTLGSSATVGGTPAASNMVAADGAGKLCKTFGAAGSFTFPIGDNTGTAEYSPVALTVSCGFEDFCFRVDDAAATHKPTGVANYITRVWVGSATASCLVYDATFTYTADDVVGTEAGIRGKRYGTALPWQTLGAVDTVNHNFTGTGLSAMGEFTAFDICLAAPLASLNAVTAPGRVAVRWETASEADTLGFNLYRAAAGGDWAKLNAAMIASQAPGSPSGYSYRYDDATAVRGASYSYRLAAVGMDGGETLLEAVQVSTPLGWYWLPVVTR